MRAQRGPNGSQWGPHDSPEGPKLEPRGPQERKIERVKNARSQKVEKLKNHENLKITKVEMLIFHSFYNENLAPPRKLRNFNEKSTVINGWDIKRMAPA